MEKKIPTPVETLVKAYKIGLEFGLKYIYIGNVHKGEYENTFCPKCNKMVVERNWAENRLRNLMKNKKCANCGEKIAGIYWKGKEVHDSDSKGINTAIFR